jgi:hypothetical protein
MASSSMYAPSDTTSSVSKQAKGGLARAEKIRFMANIKTLEEKFKLHCDDSARVQNLADLIRSTFGFQEVLSFYRDEFGRHVESIREALHDEHRLQLQQAQEEKQLVVASLQSELNALRMSFEVLQEAQATKQKLKQAVRQKRPLPKLMMEEYKKTKAARSKLRK